MSAPLPPRPVLSVLIVEDDPVQAAALARCLELEGRFRVRVAPDAAGALAAARDGPPEAAVVDIGLPGADGLAVAADLVAHCRYRPFLIALTGNPRLADPLFAAGFDRYYVRPADPAALIATLDLYRAAREAAADARSAGG